MATVFKTPADLEGAVGQHLGYSDWLEIDQARIDKFADATGDHQWIHVDPERAKDGPFGKCIAHGYLTQSLVNLFLPQIVEVQGISMGINYGAVQATVRVTVEIEGSDRPGCVIDTISRYVPAE